MSLFNELKLLIIIKTDENFVHVLSRTPFNGLQAFAVALTAIDV